MNADEHRQAAKAAHARRAESFERCDTDGFLSQWASGLTASEHELQAEILDNDGMATFTGLYEGDRRVKASMVSVYNQFSFSNDTRWVVEDDDPVCARRKWIPTGSNSRIQRRLGLHECPETAPARAAIRGQGTGLSGSAWVTTIRTGCRYGSDARRLKEMES